MIGTLRRAALAGVVGASAAALTLVAAYTIHPGLSFEMDRPLPSFVSGMFRSEFDGPTTFAWTSDRADLSIPGIDRQVAWSCTVRFRGPRPEGLATPRLAADVDGVRVFDVPATNEYQEHGILLPPSDVAHASIVLTVTPPFTPTGPDTRVLGVQIDRFICRPASKVVRPPSNALAQASLAAGIFAAGLGLLGLSLSSTMFAAVVVALGQTVLMVISSGLYGNYPSRLPPLALGVILSTVVLARLGEIWRRQSLSSSARFVLACAAAVLFLKLAGLFHPAKPIIDAMFHQHRLDALLTGAWWHVQPIGNGLQMPYAIGLYVFAAPWAWLTSDHMSLIRVVTAASDVIAGVLLYPVLLIAWGDRRAAALAAVLYQLVPLPFATLGNANLANMFGQSVALVAIAAATTWRIEPKRIGTVLGFIAITTWAFCSHVGTVTILSATLGALVVLYVWRGDALRKRAAVAIVMGTATALVLSWIIFYRHFLNEFRDASSRLFGGASVGESVTPNAAEMIKGNLTLIERAVEAGRYVMGDAGWPLLILAGLGVWSLVRRRSRDRLTSALIAWAVVWLVATVSTVVAPVDPANVRYALEFLGRINLATIPLLVILAARGAAIGWEPETAEPARRPLQTAAALLCIAAFALAVQAWLGWFNR